jgi:hypothetical protein
MERLGEMRGRKDRAIIAEALELHGIAATKEAWTLAGGSVSATAEAEPRHTIT